MVRRAGLVLAALWALAPAIQAPAAHAGTAGAGTADGATVAAIRARGELICGERAGIKGFTHTDERGRLAGFLVDYCRVIAAAVLGDADAIQVARLPDKPLDFEAVERGYVDIVLTTTTWTLSREVDYDVEFLDPLYYDGQGFAAWTDDPRLVPLDELEPSTVCVKSATTTLRNLEDYIQRTGRRWTIRTFTTLDEALQAFLGRQCELFTTDRSVLTTSLAGYRRAGLGIRILPDVISREPLTPFIARGDHVWYDLVRWAIYATILAEEKGFTSAMAKAGTVPDDPELARLLGGRPVPDSWHAPKDWARQVIAQVGNYGEIFERNLGARSPFGLERGPNRPWGLGGLLPVPLFQ
ncbi:transporter substrate-binding domain-containing protein [Azospirillum sp. ST 5-10]|uniref:transporter substrate-binding domain-containing protein n=1 Tax=unclassified Azospirillum TaxID=2630922 RepID=UPI003F49D14B